LKKALVCGASGFIGSLLVKRLKKEGYWVRAVDLKYPEFSPTAADEFLLLDRREKNNAETSVEKGAKINKSSIFGPAIIG
jgi:nucleoside-diphosphate-sugar epimerase